MNDSMLVACNVLTRMGLQPPAEPRWRMQSAPRRRAHAAANRHPGRSVGRSSWGAACGRPGKACRARLRERWCPLGASARCWARAAAAGSPTAAGRRCRACTAEGCRRGQGAGGRGRGRKTDAWTRARVSSRPPGFSWAGSATDLNAYLGYTNHYLRSDTRIEVEPARLHPSGDIQLRDSAPQNKHSPKKSRYPIALTAQP